MLMAVSCLSPVIIHTCARRGAAHRLRLGFPINPGVGDPHKQAHLQRPAGSQLLDCVSCECVLLVLSSWLARTAPRSVRHPWTLSLQLEGIAGACTVTATCAHQHLSGVGQEAALAFMPAAMRVAMASGTPACSLSSIAVNPTSSRSLSISSAA